MLASVTDDISDFGAALQTSDVNDEMANTEILNSTALNGCKQVTSTTNATFLAKRFARAPKWNSGEVAMNAALSSPVTFHSQKEGRRCA